MKKGYVSNPVINRLPRYYRCVNDLYENNCIRVSSGTLAERLGLTASQIRQDFSCFGEFGQQGYGYNVKKLRYEIQEILGINKEKTAILLGCGNLGHALLNNFRFDICGFRLLAAFDTDLSLAGTEIAGVPVLDFVTQSDEFFRRAIPDVAVLTLPGDFAQSVADALVGFGVRGIWNYTNVELKIADPRVKLENVILLDSLLTLSYKLSDDGTLS